MNPEKQRIAIAEACGWKHQKGEAPRYGGKSVPSGWISPDGEFHPSDWERKSSDGLPDYPNDRNAMIDAIKDKIAGDVDLERAFLRHLHKIQTRNADHIHPICEWEMVTLLSECEWLSEVLLRTIGKWEDE